MPLVNTRRCWIVLFLATVSGIYLFWRQVATACRESGAGYPSAGCMLSLHPLYSKHGKESANNSGLYPGGVDGNRYGYRGYSGYRRAKHCQYETQR